MNDGDKEDSKMKDKATSPRPVPPLKKEQSQLTNIKEVVTKLYQYYLLRFENERSETLVKAYIRPDCASSQQGTKQAHRKVALFDKLEHFLGIRTAVSDSSSSQSEQVLLLLGEAGAGKTSLSQYLEYQIWQEHEHKGANSIAIRMALREFDSSSVKSAITFYFEQAGLNNFAIELLRRSDVPLVFILDGYDEVHGRYRGNFAVTFHKNLGTRAVF